MAREYRTAVWTKTCGGRDYTISPVGSAPNTFFVRRQPTEENRDYSPDLLCRFGGTLEGAKGWLEDFLARQDKTAQARKLGFARLQTVFQEEKKFAKFLLPAVQQVIPGAVVEAQAPRLLEGEIKWVHDPAVTFCDAEGVQVLGIHKRVRDFSLSYRLYYEDGSAARYHRIPCNYSAQHLPAVVELVKGIVQQRVERATFQEERKVHEAAQERVAKQYSDRLKDLDAYIFRNWGKRPKPFSLSMELEEAEIKGVVELLESWKK